jgi:hypothetical protein
VERRIKKSKNKKGKGKIKEEWKEGKNEGNMG